MTHKTTNILWTIVLSFVLGCSNNEKVSLNPEENAAIMDYRSISFHLEPDSNLIKQAVEIGFNDICIQTEGDTKSRLQDLHQLEKEKGYMKMAKNLGMTVSLWMREISNYEKAWGAITLENETFWSKTAEKYDYYFTELVPEVDYIIFTVVESQVNIADNTEILNKMVELVNNKCKEYGKKLVLRTFVHLPHELDTLENRMSSFPEDIIIMSKYVESDWVLRGPHHRMIGKTGNRKQFIELDITGEYFRVTYMPNCFVNNLSERFKYWQENGADGLSVRVSREPREGAWWEPLIAGHNVYAEPNEVNLWALGYMALGKENAAEKAWKDFTVQYFGKEHADKIIGILKPQGEFLAEALNVETAPFGCGRLKMPGEWTINGEHCKCGDTVPIAYDDEEDMLYRNPFNHKYSPHVWHKELEPRYHQIRKGYRDVINKKESSANEMIALSDSLLDEFRSLKDKIDGKTYEYYLFRLEENNWHLKVMKEWQLAWLKASNILYFDDNDNKMKQKLKNHLDNLIKLNERTDEKLDIVWHGKDIRIQRGEYLDIPGYIGMFKKYWKSVIN